MGGDSSSKYSPTPENLEICIGRLQETIRLKLTTKEVELKRRYEELERWKLFKKTDRNKAIVAFIEIEIEAIKQMEVIL